jgi:hypothetical protein
MKIIMERTVNMLAENNPKKVPELQEFLSKCEPRKINNEYYFITEKNEQI